MRNPFVLLFAFLLVGATCFVVGRRTSTNAQETIVEERVDTLVVRDTVVAYKPKIVTKRVVDSVLVPVPQYIERNDTIYAVLEREQVVWEDSLARVYASGIRPEVDSVFHYTTTTVIDHFVPVKVQPRWGIGIQGGVGVGKGGLTPFVGVGVQYNILTW